MTLDCQNVCGTYYRLSRERKVYVDDVWASSKLLCQAVSIYGNFLTWRELQLSKGTTKQVRCHRSGSLSTYQPELKWGPCGQKAFVSPALDSNRSPTNLNNLYMYVTTGICSRCMNIALQPTPYRLPSSTYLHNAAGVYKGEMAGEGSVLQLEVGGEHGTEASEPATRARMKRRGRKKRKRKGEDWSVHPPRPLEVKDKTKKDNSWWLWERSCAEMI
ncbi:hypothetical protein EI94DRAFT_1784921 [Lactarius quietus]|nr:hypothetical protein EI94DRAFT_1784921 [Lactarius quietus]